MYKLSLVMIVKNEEKHLSRCLESAKDIVDEIVLVDTGSTDKTKEIALSFGAKVYDFKWINDFSAARNYSIQKSSGDWNLILDADEYIMNDCRQEIRDFINNNNAIGRIKRIDSFVRDGELQYSKTFISRLAPKSVFYKGKIHEQLDSPLPRKNINVEVGHDGYLETDKSERNLAILMDEFKEKPKDPYILFQIANTLFVSGKNSEADYYFEEFYKYAPKNAYYRYTGIVSYLYNLVALKKFEKGLEIINNEKENLYDFPDFHFVCGVFYLDLVLSDVKKYLNYMPLIEQEYLKCLEIGDTDKYDSVLGTGSFSAAYNLGTFYEVTGNKDKARYYYGIAAEYGYEPAQKRLRVLQ